MDELIAAIFAKVQATSDVYETLSSDVYYAEVPENRQMPYMVFTVITSARRETFAKSQAFEDAVVRFSLFDDRRNISNILSVYNSLNTAMNRVILGFSSKSAIGCVQGVSSGPTWLGDCWNMTVDYEITYGG